MEQGFKRKKIAVLFGGSSPEYGVSLQSAAAVIDHMDKRKYEPAAIGITHTGDWFYYAGGTERIIDDSWSGSGDCVPVTVSLRRGERSLLLMREGCAERLEIDAVFPVLHGRNGEDGTVQGMFELAGVRVPVSCVHGRGEDAESVFREAERIGYPLFVKPVKAGSSYGITKVAKESGLARAMELAFAYDDRIIVEECIPGFEVGCAVMGTEELTVGEVDEIELSKGFFDFTEKYTLKTSAIHVPARIPREMSDRVKETAKTIYRALDCGSFARVDMFLTKEGEIVFNEVNTIPGFTAHSRFPNMMKAAGVSFEEVISRILDEVL